LQCAEGVVSQWSGSSRGGISGKSANPMSAIAVAQPSALRHVG
jgi:hypothetical protein